MARIEMLRVVVSILHLRVILQDRSSDSTYALRLCCEQLTGNCTLGYGFKRITLLRD